jgi:ABC-2 type transport system permease protein
VFALLITYAYASLPEAFSGPDGASSFGLVFFLAGVTSLFVSLTAIVVTYKSIAGERESGSATILLALPTSRRDVLLGKVLGRTGVLAVPVVVGFSAATLLAWVMLDEFALLDVLAFIVTTAVFVLAYTSIVVGLSASTGSTSKASALAVGFFLVFDLLWDAVSLGAVWVVNGFSLPATMPDWMVFMNMFSPSTAYTAALTALVPDATTFDLFGGVDAFWATPWLGFAILAFWVVLPLVVGYSRFANADL